MHTASAYSSPLHMTLRITGADLQESDFIGTKMGEAQICVFTFLVLTAVCVKTVNSDRRIILVGSDGSGKSTAGNIILDKEVFKNNSANTNRGSECQCEESEVKNGEYVSIIKTPGLGEDLEKKMIECVVVHSLPGPHAFLLVINVKARSTLDETMAVKWIEDNFGSDAAMYTILLFTQTDQLKGKSLDEYISESEHLRSLRRKFGGRYHAFNNQLKDRAQVSELLQKIEKMVQDNGRAPYTNDLYEETRKELQRNMNMLKKLASGKKQKRERESTEAKLKIPLRRMARLFVGGVLAVAFLTSPSLMSAAGVAFGIYMLGN